MSNQGFAEQRSIFVFLRELAAYSILFPERCSCHVPSHDISNCHARNRQKKKKKQCSSTNGCKRKALCDLICPLSSKVSDLSPSHLYARGMVERPCRDVSRRQLLGQYSILGDSNIISVQSHNIGSLAILYSKEIVAIAGATFPISPNRSTCRGSSSFIFNSFSPSATNNRSSLVELQIL